jgi:HAD superfamily hydrolase (TIGR01509 family)
LTRARALLLDCDGVLADTELDAHLVAFNRAFRELGYDITWTPEEYAVLLGIGGGKERLRAYLGEHPEILSEPGSQIDKAVAALHRRKSEIFIELIESGAVPGRPGVRRLSEEALDRGWRVAVASTSAERSVEAVLRAVVGAELVGRVSGVFAGDIVAAKKPAPDIYEVAVREIGVEPAHTVVIEDSALGALAAHRAGLRHLVTVSHFTRDEEFPHASAVLDHLGEPGERATLRAGAEVRNAEGFVDVDSLEAVLAGT